jgi:4-hydroxy-tetrahydrodipicolinate synthase
MPRWSGVYPAATTQFKGDLSLDLDATQKVQDALIRDGVHGLVLMGTVGEGNSLEFAEKKAIMQAAHEVAHGRVPVIVGVSELTTPRGVKIAQEAERIGIDGLMVLPSMVYVPKDAELEHHFRTIAKATGLPIMLYNNPPAYRVNITMEVLRNLSDLPNIVAIKESAPDTRRITDIINAFGDRFAIFSGLDDVAFEGLLLGACGWVSGLTNVFPKESLAMVTAIKAGKLDAARVLYRWFMPLLHLDAEHDLVQTIKLAEQIVKRGSERVRLPRLPLSGKRRAEIIAMVETAIANRPKIA